MTRSLGPLVLESLLGRGGMGEVWRARDAATGEHVAVKLISAERAADPDLREAFAREVRAVASLDHPGIVRVLDYGRVPDDVDGGPLVAGSPYLAMELADGTLPDAHISCFRDARDALLAILDALAHAHARGLVHRDLKPANVLRLGRQWVLSDFGVAHAMARAAGDEPLAGAGTIDYMAPEQIRGAWRDFGPWTDLYALGVLAFELVCGERPFAGNNVAAIGYQHVAVEPPAVRARFAVPTGLHGWVRTLLAKTPRDRFQHAADARLALSELDEIVEIAPAFPGSALERATSTAPTLRADTAARRTFLGADTTTPELALEASSRTPLAFAQLAVRAGLASIAEHQRTPSPLRRGIGLGLYGLRPIPLVDRQRERTLIIGALSACALDGRPRLVVVRGPSGVGKSRLVEHTVERADEIGVARVLKVTHASIPTPANGLEAAVIACLGAHGLDAAQRIERAHQFLGAFRNRDEPDVDLGISLAALGPDVSGAPEMPPRMRDPRERHAVLARLLCAMGRQRPVVLWLDDVHWGARSLAFVEHLLGTSGDSSLPVLVLATARDDLLAERPEEHAQLARLIAHERADALDVGELATVDRTELVRALLDLSEPLARAVESRTSGNPLFAVQIVGDWVARKLLVAGPSGFALREGATAVLPDDIHALWAQRIERLIAEMSSDDAAATGAREALEIAAALGPRVESEEWEAACALSGARAPETLLDAMVRRRLARTEERGWSFVHGLLVESLSRSADEAGRRRAHHHTCAAMLRATGRTDAQTLERVGRHLLEAGDAEAALDPLRAAGDEHVAVFDLPRAHEVYALLGRAAQSAGLAPDRSHACAAIVGRARAFALQGMPRDAERSLGALGADPDPELSAVVDWVRGAIAQLDGDTAAAERMFLASIDASAARSELEWQARGQLALGNLHKLRGELVRSEVAFEAALALAANVPGRVQLGSILNGLAETCVYLGKLERAVELAERARAAHQSCGHRYGEAECVSTLGEAARRRGDIEAAEGFYRESIRMSSGVVNSHATAMRINLGLCLLARGRFDDAREVLEGARAEAARASSRVYLGFACCALLPCLAHAGTLEGWDEALAVARQLGGPGGVAHEDAAAPLQQAGELLLSAGDRARAEEVLSLARGQWERLGDDERVASITALLASRA